MRYVHNVCRFHNRWCITSHIESSTHKTSWTKMLIAQLADTHLSDPLMDDPISHSRMECLRTAVNAINKLDPSPSIIIHTGDMVQNRTHSEYKLAQILLSDLQAPLYVVPGNRDSRRMLRETFDLPGNRNEPVLYSIDTHELRLIALDTQSRDTRKGDLDEFRLRWLENTLNTNKSKPTAIFMHHPPVPITTSTFPWQFIREETREEVSAIISRHPQVIRIFCGHSHRLFRSSIATAEVSTVTSLAADLRMDDKNPLQDRDAVYHTHTLKGGSFITKTHFVPMLINHKPMHKDPPIG